MAQFANKNPVGLSAGGLFCLESHFVCRPQYFNGRRRAYIAQMARFIILTVVTEPILACFLIFGHGNDK